MTRFVAAFLSSFCFVAAIVCLLLPDAHDVTVALRLKGVSGFALGGLYFLYFYRKLSAERRTLESSLHTARTEKSEE